MSEQYKCSYCGTEYDTPLARSRCELECDEKQKQEAERQRKLRLSSERDARQAEIEAAWNRYVGLMDQYRNDYREDFPVKRSCGSWADIPSATLFDKLFYW